MRSIYWSVAPRAIGSACVVLTWFFPPASTEFPAPPSTESLIKTFSTLKVSPAHMACPVVPLWDTATFWQERMKLMFRKEPSKWNLSKLVPVCLSSRVCLVSPQHMRHMYAHMFRGWRQDWGVGWGVGRGGSVWSMYPCTHTVCQNMLKLVRGHNGGCCFWVLHTWIFDRTKVHNPT